MDTLISCVRVSIDNEYHLPDVIHSELTDEGTLRRAPTIFSGLFAQTRLCMRKFANAPGYMRHRKGTSHGKAPYNRALVHISGQFC